MRFLESPHPLVVILGPTAVGKTELSIQLAELFQGEIVSADSRQFYRGMDIGTAKPSREEQSRVRHQLIDIANPDEILSLAVFQAAAYAAIEAVHRQGRLPFLVGGTGQYLRAVIEGWEPPKLQPDGRLRDVLSQWAQVIGAEGLHARLAVLDPPAAAKILPGNVRRTVRALEVIFTTGRLFSEQMRKTTPRFAILEIGLIRPRGVLYQRIDKRIEAMIANGFIEEVQGLLRQGFSSDLPTMSAIGYGEICTYLRGELNLPEAVTLIKRRTRQFVRRQANWFRETDPQIHWFPAEQTTVEQIAAFIREKEIPDDNHE